MVAEPILLPVTTPFASTETVSASDDSQETALFVASSGVTVAVNAAVLPKYTSCVAGSETLSTATVLATTETLHTAFTELSALDVAVTVQVPSPIGVTTPLTTVATASSDEVHVTVWSVVFAGVNVGVNVLASSPTVKPNEVAIVIAVGIIFSTVTAHSPTTPLPSFAVALIVADPALIAVTKPSAETVATSVAVEDHV